MSHRKPEVTGSFISRLSKLFSVTDQRVSTVLLSNMQPLLHTLRDFYFSKPLKTIKENKTKILD